MFPIDWDAIRAYASLFILTIVALYAVWKDATDYKERAREERGTGLRRLIKRHAVKVLYAVTILAAFLGVMDVHANRHRALQERADAKADKLASQKQIEGLQAVVQDGNKLLDRQRQDFLKQFSDMSARVANLQAAVKTSDLKLEAEKLSKDLETTRRSMIAPKATIGFSFASGEYEDSQVITLPMENGIVKVPFTVVNRTETDALEGTFTFRACDACKITGTSPGFTKLDLQAENERNFDFQHIFANSRVSKMEVSIAPPPGARNFVVGILYRCRTCELPKLIGVSLPPNDQGTVFIAPQ